MLSPQREGHNLNYEDITDIYETKYDIFMMTGKNFGNPFVKKDLTEEEIQLSEV
ncbi:MAG: hypothetical protein ACLUOJ_05545 [Streptococcus salivarius]